MLEVHHLLSHERIAKLWWTGFVRLPSGYQTGRAVSLSGGGAECKNEFRVLAGEPKIGRTKKERGQSISSFLARDGDDDADREVCRRRRPSIVAALILLAERAREEREEREKDSSVLNWERGGVDVGVRGPEPSSITPFRQLGKVSETFQHWC